MKKYLFIALGLFFLAGCSSNEHNDAEIKPNVTAESTTISTEKEYDFEIYKTYLEYVDNDNKIKMTGKGKPNSDVEVYSYGISDEPIEVFKSDDLGSFEVLITAPSSGKEFTFKNDKKSMRLYLYSKAEVDAENERILADKRAAEEKKRIEDEKQAAEKKVREEERAKKEVEEAEAKRLEEENKSKEKNETDSQPREVSGSKKETLVAFTQLALSDRNLEDKYQGYEKWKVVSDPLNNNRFIITTNDANLGRVKSIFDWNGTDGSDATLIYLLVGGNEYLNNLNK